MTRKEKVGLVMRQGSALCGALEVSAGVGICVFCWKKPVVMGGGGDADRENEGT